MKSNFYCFTECVSVSEAPGKSVVP